MSSEPQLFIIGGATFAARLMDASDRNAVFATWLPSARDVARFVRYVAFDTFQTYYPRFVERLLDTQRTVVFYRPEKPLVVHAWACAGGPEILHWAYVPHALRGMGVGRAVMTAALGGYPDRIHVTSPFGPNERARFLHNPFIARSSVND